VTCFKKGPADSDFVQFGSLMALKEGGDSDRCQVNSSVVTENGLYQFYVKAVAGLDEVQSNTVSVEVKAGDGPSTPVSYDKKSMNSCEYELSFKTANDGKTTAVDVYRSDQTSFTANSSTRIMTVVMGPDQTHTFTNSRPDCGRTYFYVVRAFDSYGNGSGLIGDTDVKYNELIINQGSSTTTTTPLTQTSGARQVQASETQVRGAGDSEGTAASTSPQPSTAPETPAGSPSSEATGQQGQVLGVFDQAPDWLSQNWLVALVGFVGLAILIAAGIFVINGKRN
jgi:hypothetical protein